MNKMDERKNALEQIDNYQFERTITITALKEELKDPCFNDDMVDRLVKKIDNCNWNINFYKVKLKALDKAEKGKSEE